MSAHLSVDVNIRSSFLSWSVPSSLFSSSTRPQASICVHATETSASLHALMRQLLCRAPNKPHDTQLPSELWTLRVTTVVPGAEPLAGRGLLVHGKAP